MINAGGGGGDQAVVVGRFRHVSNPALARPFIRAGGPRRSPTAAEMGESRAQAGGSPDNNTVSDADFLGDQDTPVPHMQPIPAPAPTPPTKLARNHHGGGDCLSHREPSGMYRSNPSPPTLAESS
ncbi:unnamed protein product, partial [Discosporangium mesarthrocarpum]